LVLIALALGLYLVFVGLLYVAQRRLVFVPDTSQPDPARTGIADIQTIRFNSLDEMPLFAWYLPAAKADAFVVLYLHGNGGHIGHRGERMHSFRAAGWGVFLPEYRGYGGNPGAPSETDLALDAEAAFAELQRLGVRPERIVLYGESLGSNLAVRLAAKHAVAAVVLESPFTSIAAIGRRQYWFVPVDLLLKDPFDTLSRIGAVTSPVLIIQGGRDRLVPNEMGRTLFAALTARKEIWVAPDADHNDLAMFGAIDAAVSFVGGLAPVRASSADPIVP